MAARVVAACAALQGPVAHLADAAFFGHSSLPSFTIGAFSTTPLVDVVQGLQVRATSQEAAFRLDWQYAEALRQGVLELAQHDPDLFDWASAIRPPDLKDVSAEMFQNMNTFEDTRFLQLAFAPIYQPPKLPRLLPRPPQQPL